MGNLKILLLEDEEMLAEIEIEALSKNGYEVSWCKSIQELRKENLSDFLLIISDVSLPDGNAMDVLQQLKMNYSHLPVVFQTGMLDVEKALQGFHIGAVSVVEKPFKLDDMITIIEKYEYLLRLSKSNPSVLSKAKAYLKIANI
jgi:two-component system response regulator AtoC